MKKDYNLFMAQSERPVAPDSTFDSNTLSNWDKLDLYTLVNSNLKKNDTKPYVFVDGPPYANGGAHVGHLLNKVTKDLVVKGQWYLGNEVQWTPGWDCHGLPLELQVDKKFPDASVSEKKKYCKNLALRSVSKQRKDFKAVGVHADFNHPYLTLSEDMKAFSWKTLLQMYKQDLLEYKMWPVHHCPACGSSLAEAELEYYEKERNEAYFKYSLGNNEYALVWTTTPWTLPMNQALAFNEKFTYNKYTNDTEVVYVDSTLPELLSNKLLEDGYVLVDTVLGSFFTDKTGLAPLFNKSTPLLHGDFVESGSTGFVHVAGAHGVEDYELVVKHDYEPFNLLDKHGRYTEHPELDPSFYGLKNLSVDNLVFEKLSNLLFLKVTQKVDTAHCWRHKTKVYYQATKQVFLNLDVLKPRVSQMLDNGSLSPAVYENLKSMLLNRAHWCLSRQRYWGTELNLLVDKDTEKLSPLTEDYLTYYSVGDFESADKLLNDNPSVYAVKDVLDVWFDSGNVVYALGNLKGFSQADFVLEGKDQYRGWFQSLLWMQSVHSNELPYKNVYVHGFVLDDKKMKFSKSSGNGLDAKTALEKFGADTLRLWASLQEENTDAVFSETKLNEAKTYYKRLRLSLRFLTSNTYKLNNSEHTKNLLEFKKLDSFDFYNYVLFETNKFEEEFSNLLKTHQYKKAAYELYTFTDKFLSQFVFEVLKQPFYLKSPSTLEKKMAQCCSYELMKSLLRMVSVFCPFVGEEFFSVTGLTDVTSVFLLKKENHEFTYKYDWDNAFNFRKMVHHKLEPLQQQKLAKGLNQLKCEFTLDLKSLGDFNNFNTVMPSTYWLGVSEALAVLGENNVELENLELNQDYHKCPRCWNFEPKVKFMDDVCSDCQTSLA